MANITACHWSTTGYAYETPGGDCSCKPAAPPGVVLYEGELAAMEHERDVLVAEALRDDERLDELRDNRPRDFEACLASAAAKLRGLSGVGERRG